MTAPETPLATPTPPYIPVQPGPPYVAYPPFPPRPIPVAPGGVPLADTWARFVAYIIDSVILMFANLIPVAVAVVVMFGRFRDTFDDMQRSNEAAINNAQVPNTFPLLWHLLLLELVILAIAVPFMLLFSYLYFVEFSYRNGQTVGKKIMNIKVVRAADSGPVTKRIMVRRWLVFHVASLFAPYFSYADCLWLLWDKPFQQCLHDKCADTVVVKSRP